MKRFFLFLTLATAAVPSLWAQVNTSPARNRSVSGTNPNTSNPYAARQENTATIGVSGVSDGALLSNNNPVGVFHTSGWTSGAANDAAGYFYWSVQPVQGTSFTGGNLRFTLFRNDAGPQEYVLRSSLDNFASDLGSGVIPDATSNISIPVALPEGITLSPDSPVVFRLYAYGARTRFGTLTVNNIAYAGARVPVTTGLYGFGAVGDENGAVLTWKTELENGLSRYEIERSADGKLYEIIGTVPIRNERVNAYRYEDLKPFRIRNFYRLAVVDMSGGRNLSRAVLVNGSPVTTLEGPLSATPNPVTGSEITVNHPVAAPNAVLRITDIAGQEIYMAAVIEGSVVTNIQNLNLAKGNYYLTLENGDTRYATTLVK